MSKTKHMLTIMLKIAPIISMQSHTVKSTLTTNDYIYHLTVNC